MSTVSSPRTPMTRVGRFFCFGPSDPISTSAASVARSAELSVERRRAATVGRGQRHELEAEVAPERAHGVDHLGRDLAADRGDAKVAVEELEPIVAERHDEWR